MKLVDASNKLSKEAEEILDDLESIFRVSKPKPGTATLGEGYKEQVKTHRDKFPVGKKGTPKEVEEKFAKFFMLFPEFANWEMVQKATDLYLSEERDEKYIMKAGNFISVERGGSVIHTLYEYCERITGGEQTNEQNFPMFSVG